MRPIFLALFSLSALSAQAADLPANVREIFKLVDSNCGGNGSGGIAQFAVKDFKAGKALRAMKAGEKSCKEDRSYSRNITDGISMFKEHLKDEYTAKCIDENLNETQQGGLMNIITDPSNIAVFGSIFHAGGDGNAESCMYYTFQIYRADGFMLEFTFNYTD